MAVTVAELKKKLRYWIRVVNTGFLPASPKDV